MKTFGATGEMETTMAEPKHLVRSHALPADEAIHIRHPLNPNSEVLIQRLSDRVGMKRAQLSLACVPPGRESYIPHAHTVEEEFIFILEGTGRAQIGDQVVDVGPGDYMGFPTDGTVHHLTKTGSENLVYLQGGERAEVEVARFPTVGKIGMFKDRAVRFYSESTAEQLPLSAWRARQD
jgi:uncharacterized cupin superfamily protein